MIQNVFVVKDGIALVSQNFGECHSLGPDTNLITSYLFALRSISKAITGTSIQTMTFENLAFYFYKKENNQDPFFLVVTDLDDKPDDINLKIKKIANLFEKKYSQIIKNFKGLITPFRDFGEILIEMNIAQRNCGESSECEVCQNNEKESELVKISKTLKKSYFSRIKSLFKKH